MVTPKIKLFFLLRGKRKSGFVYEQVQKLIPNFAILQDGPLHYECWPNLALFGRGRPSQLEQEG
jgi:hypothetical protein